MASCVRNIYTKNYQNLTTGFQVTVKNVRDVFWDTMYCKLSKCIGQTPCLYEHYLVHFVNNKCKNGCQLSGFGTG